MVSFEHLVLTQKHEAFLFCYTSAVQTNELGAINLDVKGCVQLRLCPGTKRKQV